VQTSLLAGWPNLAQAAPDAFKNTAFALSMLLVFRTNSSYSRWLDARKLWGSLVNRTRDFARQVSCPPCCVGVPD
jgi:predicted membrane chloride channel (bestrophin family)